MSETQKSVSNNSVALKVCRTYTTTVEGKEVVKTRWPIVGRLVSLESGKQQVHLDFEPIKKEDGAYETLFAFPANDNGA